MIEWRRRLAMAPEDVIHKTFQATTQFHLNLEVENRMVPNMHMKARAPGLRHLRQHESISSNKLYQQQCLTVATHAANSS